MRSAWNKILTSAEAWHIDPKTISPALLPLDWLDDSERALLGEFGGKNLRNNYLVTRILCRAALSHYADVAPADWRFERSAHGKPKIVSPGGYSSLRFNITHTEGLIVCVVSRAGAVGVDAERISRRVNIYQVARHFFAPSEQCQLPALAPAKSLRRFFEIWVLKEAYLKGRGRGLSESLKRVEIIFDSAGMPLPIKGWQLSLHNLGPHHVAATAVRAGEPIPIVWREAGELFKA
jgi:4'-phosphopantetheinyl transferase